MDKVIQEAIQVFCPICARGVLIRNESMYKCPKCQREVCRPCFDKEQRLCLDCCDPQLRGKPRAGREPEPRTPGEAVPAPPPEPSRNRTKQGIWFFLTGITAFVVIMLLSLFVSVPVWLTPVVAGVGVISFVAGIIMILKD